MKPLSLARPRKLKSQAVKLTRAVLMLRSDGSSRYAIAIALGLSQRRVQTILDGAASRDELSPFAARERDADYATVAMALRTGSTLRAEHQKYSARHPAPYSYAFFWRRFEDWLGCQPDSVAQPPGQPAPSRALVEGSSREPAPRGRGVEGKSPRAGAEPVEASPRETDRTQIEGQELEGGLLFISEPDTALQIRKGALCIRYRDGFERIFPRGRHRLRSIILACAGANVTIEAMRFAIDEGITIFIMHRAGEALAVLTDAPTVNASARALELRRAQFGSDPKQRLEITRAILAMKIEACELTERETQDTLRGLAEARDHAKLLIVEALVAKAYWRRYVGFRLRLTDRCPAVWSIFRGRLEKHGAKLVPRWARTPCNAALNYGYAVVLGNCTRALVGLGLDPSFGFLHHADTSGRLSLSYDVIELMRPRVDACVFRFLNSRPFDRKEFVENGTQVLLAPKLAREVALRVLAEVRPSECEEATRRVARCIRGPMRTGS